VTTVPIDLPEIVTIAAAGWLLIMLVRLVTDRIIDRRDGNALRDATNALKIRQVQVDAARAQLVTLCDQAREHLAVLAAFREGYEIFRSDVLLDEVAAFHPSCRHGVDSLTAALSPVESRTIPMPTAGENGR
jgi:hypothetical protein